MGWIVALLLSVSAAWAGCSVPGEVNPLVRQANAARTICHPGWVETVRPPTSYTGKIKTQLKAKLGLPGKVSDYELDHCIPLELGGHPTSPKNLWMQPWHGKCGAHAKDKLENSLHRQVCANPRMLNQARVTVRKWC